MKTNNEPKRCPFCGGAREYQEHEAKAVPGRPLVKFWRHPWNGCFCDGFEIAPDEVAAWNVRAGEC